MPLEVCGCACISLRAYSLICYYKFDWLTCANNFKLVLKSGLPTLLLTSVSCLQVAGPSSPPASAPGRALIGKSSSFAYRYIERLDKETIPLSFEVILPSNCIQTGGIFALQQFWAWFSDPKCSFENPIRLHSAEKRSHVSVVKPASFFRWQS